MGIAVDISDRLYDYTDEEKAAEAIADFQVEIGLDDEAVLAVWEDSTDPRREELERRVIDAVDANGTVRRAQNHVPAGITLTLAE